MAGSVILIVLDGAFIRRTINSFFESTPHHLMFVSSGEKAFERLPEIKPDLVISALHLPQMDGLTLYRLVRQHPQGYRVPFILLGGQSHSAPDPRLAVERPEVVLDGPLEREAFTHAVASLLFLGPRREENLEGEDTIDFADATEPRLDAYPNNSVPLSHPPFSYRIGKDGVSKASGESQVDELLDASLEVPTSVGIPSPFGAETPLSEDPSSKEDVSFTDESSSSASIAISIADDGSLTDPGGTSITETAKESDADFPIGDDASQSIDQKATLVLDMGGMGLKTLTAPAPVVTASANASSSTGDLDESQLGKRLAKRIDDLHAILDGCSHYELLGVPTNASNDLIARAHYELCIELDPERFVLLQARELVSKVEAIFARVCEAHAVLMDPQRRADYDAQHRRKAEENTAFEHDGTHRQYVPFDVRADKPEVQRFLDLANRAFLAGDLNNARLNLQLALIKDHRNDRLRAVLHDLAQAIRPWM